jgi:hypothetical protein
MTAEEKVWQVSYALCAQAIAGGTVHHATMISLLTEALRTTEAEAEQRFLAFHNEQVNKVVALAVADARQQERQTCAGMVEALAKLYETVSTQGLALEPQHLRQLAQKIRARGTP